MYFDSFAYTILYLNFCCFCFRRLELIGVWPLAPIPRCSSSRWWRWWQCTSASGRPAWSACLAPWTTIPTRSSRGRTCQQPPVKLINKIQFAMAWIIMALLIQVNLFHDKNVTRQMWSCSRVSRYNDFLNEVDQKFFSLIIWIIKNLKRIDVKCHFF